MVHIDRQGQGWKGDSGESTSSPICSAYEQRIIIKQLILYIIKSHFQNENPILGVYCYTQLIIILLFEKLHNFFSLLYSTPLLRFIIFIYFDFFDRLSRFEHDLWSLRPPIRILEGFLFLKVSIWRRWTILIMRLISSIRIFTINIRIHFIFLCIHIPITILLIHKYSLVLKLSQCFLINLNFSGCFCWVILFGQLIEINNFILLILVKLLCIFCKWPLSFLLRYCIFIGCPLHTNYWFRSEISSTVFGIIFALAALN